MWERTLQDLIRGLRANKKDESKFIAQAVDEIRQEIKSKDMEIKAAAVLKLTYLHMMGYDMGWASFHVVEVMSAPRIHLKTIGYLAAAESFKEDTDVLMLTTNLLKKDLGSRPEEVAIALNGLSHIVTPELARDLSPEIVATLNHSRPHIRKRAVLAMYKVLTKYPEILPQSMNRLRDKLDDSDPGVVAATVNVLCELAHRNPRDYLPLAPHLFHLLTTSSNNWMLIKIIKLFGTLTPYEPRLVKKLQPPITDLISTTAAISLLYECVRTCIIGGMLHGHSGNALARTCVTKLAGFLQDADQNLKYIALLAMVNIVPSHPELVAEYQDMILSSVNDEDISIRMRALDLVSAMVSRHNLQPILQQLLSHLVKSESVALPSASEALSQFATSPNAPIVRPAALPSQSPAYRLTLAQRILALGSQDVYANVTDFEWYISVLVDLAYVARVNIGEEIREQLVDIAGRVRAARRYAVQVMVKLLSDDAFLHNASDEGGCPEVLWAAAWICGEYCSELAEPHKLLSYLLQPRIVSLPTEIIAVYLHAAMKVFGSWGAELADRWDDDDLPKVRGVVDDVLERLSSFVTSPDIEVQERAAELLQLFTFVRADLAAFKPHPRSELLYGDAGAETFGGSSSPPIAEPQFPKSLYLIKPLFGAYELNAVALTAQASVPVPEGLDLEAWIVPPQEEPVLSQDTATEEAPEGKRVKKGKKDTGKTKRKGKGKGKAREDESGDEEGGHAPATPVAETAEERAERERVSVGRKAERLERLRDDPYYLIDDRTAPARLDAPDVDSIPVVKLDDLPPLSQAATVSSYLPSLRSSPAPPAQTFVIDRTGEMPEGARSPPPQPVGQSPRSSGSPAPYGNRSRAGTPLAVGAPTAAPLPSRFPAYDLDADEPRPGTPEPIKVMRAKKKGSGSGKKEKKRTQSRKTDGSTTQT
ncbi:Adaptor protein complex AP-3 delta subunit [Lentinus tigrinus ALCF2SS1-7]|uniref:AP-3 complex subunit delta n=1 Tax=Lentinus tigrinus ALCF2SS1-6 TaxID=1328759 RepID=A0A5C2SN14_9APHY|nr:Adaptor protein complex AP-3 delta subunit [Lentinus tigrinus ALCF2SS1-6]RPD82811.1 Adaptor protein complex AP-3 delta subunit [Lentinus tigrinus ALCF2SS1-7]